MDICGLKSDQPGQAGQDEPGPKGLWIKLPGGRVTWQEPGITEVYDEKGLRRCLRGYLSDESRARFRGENFSTETCFLKGIEHLTNGLKVLLGA
jgi:hypothetical protein